MRLYLLFAALLLSAFIIQAQPYTVGTQTVTFTDAARSNRSIAVEVRYPGTNAAMVSDSFPFIVFGHGFQMTGNNYYAVLDSLVKQGYIVALPGTETSLSPVHADFAKDLIFIYNKLISESQSNASSFLYNHVKPRGAIGGHSMGGGSTVLSVQYGTPATCYFTFAAANTNPSSISAAHFMDKPYLAFAGSRDCIAPPATHQIPMYDSSAAPCKVYIGILDATHCQFGPGSVACNFGEGFSGCASTPLSSTAQINKALSFLTPYLNYYLKQQCPAWLQFEATYAANTTDDKRRNCTNTIPANPVITGITDFCTGSNTVLTATPAGFTYSWSNAVTTQTNTISAAGNYGVTISNGVCAVTAAPVAITELALPLTPSAITMPDTVCAGMSNIEIVTPVSLPGEYYIWTLPGGWGITSGDSTNVIYAVAGNAGGSVTVAIGNSCGLGQAISATAAVRPTNLSTPSPITMLDSVCLFTNITVSVVNDSNVTTYNWVLPSGFTVVSGSGTNSLVVYAGNIGGTVSVTAQNACGISQAVSKFVQAEGSSIGPIFGDDTICTGGGDRTFSVAPVSMSNMYAWTVPQDWTVIDGTTNTLQVIAGASSGLVTVTSQNACGTLPSVSMYVTMISASPVPGPVSGPDSICQGLPVLFRVAPVPGALTYYWQLPPGWLTTGATDVDSIIVTPFGGDSLSVFTSNQCGVNGESSKHVYVAMPPNLTGQIIGPDTVCQGGSMGTFFSLDPFPAGNYMYHWSIPGNWSFFASPNSAAPVINVNSGGLVQVYSSNGCGNSDTLALNIAMVDTPAAQIGVVGTALHALPAGSGYTHQWYRDGQLIQGADSSIYTPVQDGSYTVVIGGLHFCQGQSAAIDFIYSGLQTPTHTGFQLYPNPVTNGSLQLTGGEKMVNSIIRMLDAQGKEVLQMLINAPQTTIQLPKIAAGIYIVILQKQDVYLQQKVVVF